MALYDRCPNCFMQMGEGSVCHNCGNDYLKNKKYAGVLPAFSELNNRYVVGRVLGKGGFGVTYIAMDTALNKICAIKEYMPSEYSTRSAGTKSIIPLSDDKSRMVFVHGRDKFVLEARNLIKLRSNPTVVDILDYFNQNNTAYIVMEYLDGQNLRELIKSSGGKIDPDYAKQIFLTAASALMEIHRKGILHRDLSPENIIVTKSGNVKLIDFGAARNFVIAENRGMSILLKPGFAPPEQYTKKDQGPWSDVYALCATFYTIVSGKPLVDALFRYRGEQQPSLEALGCNVTKKTSDVIERGMSLEINQRYKDFKELLDDIDVDVKVTPKPTPAPSVVKTPTPIASVPKPPAFIPRQASASVEPKKAPFIAAIVGGALCNKVYIHGKDVFKIGRSEQSCQYIVAGDTNVSRIHCYVRVDNNHLYLCDASANGTFLENGTKLIKNKEYEIAPGSKFYLATRNHMLVLNI